MLQAIASMAHLAWLTLHVHHPLKGNLLAVEQEYEESVSFIFLSSCIGLTMVLPEQWGVDEVSDDG
jgi:hypothetical protein